MPGRLMSSAVTADAPRRSNAVLAAFSGPCLPLAAFGVALPVTLPEFYATHVGLELGVVAAVFMAVRLIDIVFDPFIGWGMDKTKTAFGRYRPWMILSTPILMLSALMMFVLVQPGAGPAYLFALAAGALPRLLDRHPGPARLGGGSGARSTTSAAASMAGGRCSTSSASS